MAYIKEREKAVNTDISAKYNIHFVSLEDAVVASDEISDTKSDATIDNQSDQPYSLKETSECDYSCDTNHQSHESLENIFLEEQKHLVFWSSLLLLFRYCFACKEKTKITSVRTRGSILVVIMKCHNKYIHT